jgi:IS5 family transposase
LGGRKVENFLDYALKNKYEKVKSLRPRLEEMKNLLNWNAFLKLFPDYKKDRRGRGRPYYNRILMLKILFLQSWYNISDEEIEFQCHDRLSFQQFLDYPKNIPDYSTIWRFREYLVQTDLAVEIWKELHRQIESHNIQIQEGVIQDACFITADPGKTNSGMNDRGEKAKTSRNRDGSWTKKNNKNYFGYKLHTKVNRGSKIISEIAVTTASVHDSEVDLATPEDIIYRDKAFTGTNSKAKGNASMVRGKLSIWGKLRNKRIMKKRAQGEHPYATINRSFNGGTTKLTTISRVFVQQIFVCAGYNLYRLCYLKKSN